jgi:hypothetical protein
MDCFGAEAPRNDENSEAPRDDEKSEAPRNDETLRHREAVLAAVAIQLQELRCWLWIASGLKPLAMTRRVKRLAMTKVVKAARNDG